MKLRKRKKQIDKTYLHMLYNNQTLPYRKWLIIHFKTLNYTKIFHKRKYR